MGWHGNGEYHLPQSECFQENAISTCPQAHSLKLNHTKTILLVERSESSVIIANIKLVNKAMNAFFGDL